MSFFKKLFKSKEPSNEIAEKKPIVKLSIDDAFVHNFISKGGKFLYCISEKEIINNLNQIISGNDLSDNQMTDVMTEIMTGKLSSSQIAGFMIGMRIKGEAIEEIAAAAKVMRDHSNSVTLNNRKHLIDTCGTGGDSLQTFNVSTVSALIAAAGGRVLQNMGEDQFHQNVVVQMFLKK